jgi:uncharacterized membrane protein YeaQ/YmgE (transglycosylase-associated protein family)
MGLCGWIVFGLVIGLIARAIMPGQQGMGLIKTTLLGIAGSFMGGFLASVIRGGTWFRLESSGIIGSILGAIVLLWLGRMMSGRR